MCGNFQNVEWGDGQYQYSDILDLLVGGRSNISSRIFHINQGEESGPSKYLN